MNNENLQLMSTMLGEVVAGTWKGTPVDHGLIIGPIKVFPAHIKHFNLESWVEQQYDEKGKTCGFSACAVGHACYDPRFQALGLVMDHRNRPSLPAMSNDFNNWDAVMALFEINEDTAHNLFIDAHYVGYAKYGVKPGQVKSRVDELLVIGEDVFNEQCKAQRAADFKQKQEQKLKELVSE